ncbi:CPBP family intramembrane glutamic endopeptidase [Kocuria rhizophila]|uniref:CPBP family intramembrane glutamic endopeptidase n=1 Tax=Kocuria rhizophila TaxID=72000 RepID=UPI0022F0F00A|nr:CPBP family intramembrane glutamic endopeptidase [Kocuria rhizophila]MDA4829716.1 CPBP family intramembrane metalloprotease [Kocuria rhizophila]
MKKRTGTPRSKSPSLFDTWGREWFRVRDVIGPGYFSARVFSPGLAYVLVLGLYAGSGYAWATADVVIHWVNGDPLEANFGFPTVVGRLQAIVLSVVLWIVVKRLLVLPEPRDTRPATVRRDAWLAGMAYWWVILVVLCAMEWVGEVIGYNPDFPQPDNPTAEYVIGSFSSSAAAGFREEIFLLAVPVLLLRSAGQRWRLIIPLLAVLRVSFHVYYGPACVVLLVWAALAVVMFRYTQSVWPLVLAHSLYDVTTDAASLLGDGGLVKELVSVVAAIGFLTIFLLKKTSRDVEVPSLASRDANASEQGLLSGGDSA